MCVLFPLTLPALDSPVVRLARDGLRITVTALRVAFLG